MAPPAIAQVHNWGARQPSRKRKRTVVKPACLASLLLVLPGHLSAQTTDAAEPDDTELLTQAELETLVAPVALFPDTLLIQILVAATYPMEIVKSERLLASNADLEPEALKAVVEAEQYDPSVEVLATAFPDVISDMAEHIEWSEAMGSAMLAQRVKFLESNA